MAINTAARRASVLSEPWVPFLIPDGTISVGDMRTLTGVYSGIDTLSVANPDPFELGSQVGIALSTADVLSNIITVSGLGVSVTADVTLSGDASAEYQKNGGAWATIATTAVDGDTFRVRVDASASYNSTVFGILQIGFRSDTFQVTTLRDPAAVTTGGAARKISRLHGRR